MKTILRLVLKNVRWQDALLLVWDVIDDKIKSQVQKTPNKIDDEAFKVLDKLIKDLAAEAA